MRIQHFYHVYADGNWQQAFEEHREALSHIRLPMDVTVGIVGSIENRARVLGKMPSNWWPVHTVQGHEQHTLRLIHQNAHLLTGPVLYAHSKGSANPTEWSDAWRRCMTHHLITEADVALDRLAGGADTVGVHWLTPEEHPDHVQIPYYGGNFWWAMPKHLVRLPEPSNETRYHAEAWLGTVRPENPVDLQPGWPGAACLHHGAPLWNDQP